MCFIASVSYSNEDREINRSICESDQQKIHIEIKTENSSCELIWFAIGLLNFRAFKRSKKERATRSIVAGGWWR